MKKRILAAVFAVITLTTGCTIRTESSVEENLSSSAIETSSISPSSESDKHENTYDSSYSAEQDSSKIEASSSTDSEDNSDPRLDELLETINTEYLPLYGIMINCEDWSDANEIPVSMYFAWYRDYINSITSYEERLAQYKINSPKYQAGWAYPAEEFENFVLQHFDVDIEYLRNSNVFQPDENVYWLPAGGAIKNYQMKVASVDDFSVQEDLIVAMVSCSATGDFTDIIYKELKMIPSSGQIKFISCCSI